MNFIRRLNRAKLLFFKPEFSNFMANWRYKSYGKIQNFSSISKIIPARPKKHRYMGCEYHYN